MSHTGLVRPFAVAALLTATLSACGDDESKTADAEVVPTSPVCGLIPGEALATLLPGATIDTSIRADDTCAYTADAGDLLVSAVRTSDRKKALAVTETAISDATGSGAKTVRKAELLGQTGRTAINATDGEITVAWTHNGNAYTVQFSGWEGRATNAAQQAEYLAKVAQPLP